MITLEPMFDPPIGSLSDSVAQAWQARNDEYLSAALAGLRRSLEAAAQPRRTAATGVADEVRAAAPAPPVPAAAAAAATAATASSAFTAAPAASVNTDSGWARFIRRSPPRVVPATAQALRLEFTHDAAAPADALEGESAGKSAGESAGEPAAAQGPAAQANVDEDDNDGTDARLAMSFEGEPSPAMLLLSRRFGLSDFERDVLLLCVALELDTGTAARCAAVHRQPDRDHPTFALAMVISAHPAWEALSPERPLRHWRLIEINQPPGRALTASALRADERIVNYVKGLNHLDDRLAPLLVPMPPVSMALLPPSHRDAANLLLRRLAQAVAGLPQRRDGGQVGDQGGDQFGDGSTSGARPPLAMVPGAPPSLVLLRGLSRDSKHRVAAACMAALGLRLYRLPAEQLPAHAGELEQLARLWHRESLLLPAVLYIDAHAADTGPSTPEGLGSRISRFAMRTGGLVFIDSRDGLSLPLAPVAALDIGKPTTAEQLAAWRQVLATVAPLAAGQATLAPDHPGPGLGLGESAAAPVAPLPALAARLAAQFDLGQTDIEAIAASVAAAMPDEPPTELTAATRVTVEQRLWRACLESTRPTLARLADKLDAKATWEQIVLPPAEAAQLRQIAAQVNARSTVYDDWGFRARMNRGLGVSALFAGDSGTGKTMAAEVLANELQLDLYRIDLSAVVSKYIGETEKNLREVFDAAECGGAILLFDEADALFGKRSEVKDSHDRYANIEIDYLLQRIEAFSGVALLSTNMKSSLDTAFMRRLRFVVNFPYPSAAERRRMWQRAFPPETPLGVIDAERLARLNLTGGNIHNIALNAAFMAARAATPVTMNLLLEAARAEFRKLERPVNEADFRWAPAVSTQGLQP